MRAWLDPSIDVYANRTLFGDETREQTRVRNQVAMDDAKQADVDGDGAGDACDAKPLDATQR